MEPDFTKVTRIEVIDHYTPAGRAYVFWEKDAEVELQLQDNERTLKIFINKKP